jgi:hypothetical protein
MRTLTVLATVLVLASAVPTSAQQVRLEFNNGNVTLRAENAPIRTILAEWSKRGGTRIINGDRVGGGPVTLELMGVPELQAIEILLRGVAGYMVGRRELVVTGPSLSSPSVFDRIHILPTSAAPRAAGPVPLAAPPRPLALPRPPAPAPDDLDDPIDDELAAEADAADARRPAPGAGFPPVRPVNTPGPGQFPVTESEDGGAQPTRPTAPGGNPFGAVVGTSRPGVIVPVERPAGSERSPSETQNR